jgi:hypothetical protein
MMSKRQQAMTKLQLMWHRHAETLPQWMREEIMEVFLLEGTPDEWNMEAVTFLIRKINKEIQ